MKTQNNHIVYERPVLSLTSLELEDCVLECCSIKTVEFGVQVDEYKNMGDEALDVVEW